MQLAIISGKGGTGKTSLAASFSYLSDIKTVKIDCDVDAANLHLMHDYKNLEEEKFYGAKLAVIDKNTCIECNRCVQVCRYNAIEDFVVNDLKCEGCGACQVACDFGAIDLKSDETGKTIISQSAYGYLSRAKMYAGADGSGKLVTAVRKQVESYGDHFIIDGSPGIGCAVMASITGCETSLIVTEPTQSGYEDLIRVIALTDHFDMEIYVVINKYDLNEEMSNMIEDYCHSNGIEVVGKIPFDEIVSQSINEGKPIVMYTSKASEAIGSIWSKLVHKKVIL